MKQIAQYRYLLERNTSPSALRRFCILTDSPDFVYLSYRTIRELKPNISKRHSPGTLTYIRIEEQSTFTMTEQTEDWSDVEKDSIGFDIEPGNPESNMSWRAPVTTKEELEEKVDEYGFPSRAAFLRHMVRLGMNTLVEQDPVNTNQNTGDQEGDPVTIRELIPEGEENAVDMTDELWDEILRDRMLDIVEQDPEIERDGFRIYR